MGLVEESGLAKVPRLAALSRAPLVVAAVALATAAQWQLAGIGEDEGFSRGLLLYAVALPLFAVAGGGLGGAGSTSPGGGANGSFVNRAFVVSALLLAASVVVLLARHPADDRLLTIPWALAIAIYLAAFRKGLAGFSPGAPAFESGREAVVVLALASLAFALRASWIETIPWTVGGDEGSQGLEARRVLAGSVRHFFGTGWLGVPNLQFCWQAVCLWFFGDNLLGLRLPWAMVGTSTVALSYLLVRRLFGGRLAALVAFLLATYHFHIHYSRLGSHQIGDGLFMTGTLLALVTAVEERSRLAWATAGVIAGLGFFFYAGSRQAVVIVAAVLLWCLLFDREKLRGQRGGLFAIAGGLLITAGPMLLFAIQHPNDFNARVNQIGIFQSGWLGREIISSGKTAGTILLEQFQKAFLAFNHYPDRVLWYGSRIPLMEFWASIFFALGAALALRRLTAWRYAVFVIWFILVVGIGGALTENPPSSMRLVSSAIPATLFVAIALDEIASRIAPVPRVSRVLCWLGAVALGTLSVRYYFGPYQASWVYGNFNGEVATRLGYYLRDLGPTWKEYFFGAPRMYADFSSTPFLAPGVELYDVKAPTPSLEFVDHHHHSVFVFLPERLGELAQVRAALPGGTLDQVHRQDDPKKPLLFTAYRVPGS